MTTIEPSRRSKARSIRLRAKSRPGLTAALIATVLSTSLSAHSATILDRNIDIEIDGRQLTERIDFVVSIDGPGDLSTWSEYGFIVDDHITLVECSAQILDSNGKIVKEILSKAHRREPSVGFGLHTSTDAVVVPFDGLKIGQQIRLSLTRKYRPLYLAYSVPLATKAKQRALEVRVRGGGDRFRWALQAADEIISVEELEDGFVIQGTDILGHTEPDHAADNISVLPMVRFAWDTDPTWRGVGAWYSTLVENRLGDSPSAAALAKSITANAESNRERLVTITEFVKRQIRYEAVEIGEGGWVPSPADKVLERGWGDCKDKSQLLADMLRAVGVEANLVLLLAGRTGQIDISFPSTLGFNHCIVAVPSEGIDLSEDDPVADGMLFIDATMDRGDPLWLSPYNQGQWVVVAAGTKSRLVQIPIIVKDERRTLVVDGVADLEGGFRGMAVLQLTGSRALSWVRDLDMEAPERIDEQIRNYFQYLIPGGTLTAVGWREIEGSVPSIHFQAELALDGFVRGSSERRRIRPGFLMGFPEARELEGRTSPVVLTPGRHITQWRVTLPDEWCPPATADEQHLNSVGRVSASTGLDENGRLIVDRRITVFRWWYGPESFGHLRELSVAENKTARRSVRLDCLEDGS